MGEAIRSFQSDVSSGLRSKDSQSFEDGDGAQKWHRDGQGRPGASSTVLICRYLDLWMTIERPPMA